VSRPREVGAVLARCGGAAFAALLLVGRTDLSRLVASAPPGPAAELRLYLIVALAFAALAAWSTGREDTALESAPASDMLALGLMWAALLFAGLSFVWSWGDTAALRKLHDVGLMCVAVGLVAVMVRRWPASTAEGFWFAVLGLGVFLTAVGMRAIGSAATGQGRLAVLGGGPNVFGRLMGLLVMACLWSLSRWGGLVRIALVVCAGVGALLGLLSGSRGALGGIMAGLATYVWIERVSFRRVGVVVGASLLALVPIVLGMGLWSRVQNIVSQRIVADLVTRLYTSGRTGIYHFALSRSWEALAIGHGLGSFSYHSFPYPHNILLELTYEAGAPAAVALLVGAVWLLVRLLGSRRAGTGVTGGAWVMILVASMFSGDLYDARAVFLLPLLLLCPAPRLATPRQSQVR
jgi:hypothetical protein